MYKVLVADDEPIAVANICKIIETRSADFEVSGRADNGKDALEIIRNQDIDLVISDIMMPRPNGVELARIVHEEKPDVCMMLLSGFADFEYAQSAIRSGVIEYILKPITPSKILNSLNLAKKHIEKIQYRQRNIVLKRLCSGEEIAGEIQKKFLPEENYYLVLIRRNGLPNRLRVGKSGEIFSDMEETLVAFGRDEMEVLYLLPENLVEQAVLETYIEGLQDKIKSPGDYISTVYTGQTVSRGKLQDTILDMYRELDCITTIGRDRQVDMFGSRPREQDEISCREELDRRLLEVRQTISDHRQENAQNLFEEIMETMKREEVSQLDVEQVVREVIYSLQRNQHINRPVNEREYLMEEVFSGSENMDALTKSLVEILFPQKEENTSASGNDPEDIFHRIDDFLKNHLQENISMQTLCSNFGLSQPYISKLFRKYTTQSFSQYLTGLRMERAKTLLTETDSFIKDVAAMVGYSDQFYFSRIFRTYIGKSPSEFVRDKEAN